MCGQIDGWTTRQRDKNKDYTPIIGSASTAAMRNI
jgi:hypothetical protein